MLNQGARTTSGIDLLYWVANFKHILYCSVVFVNYLMKVKNTVYGGFTNLIIINFEQIIRHWNSNHLNHLKDHGNNMLPLEISQERVLD